MTDKAGQRQKMTDKDGFMTDKSGFVTNKRFEITKKSEREDTDKT